VWGNIDVVQSVNDVQTQVISDNCINQQRDTNISLIETEMHKKSRKEIEFKRVESERILYIPF